MKTLPITLEQLKYLNAKPEVKVLLGPSESVVVNASGTIVEVTGSTYFVKGENVNMEVQP